jgi:type VI secretion system protein ImpC
MGKRPVEAPAQPPDKINIASARDSRQNPTGRRSPERAARATCLQEPSMPGRLEFDLGFGRPGRPREESEPMRLLLLGDFSGKAPADRAPLATRATQRVDIDNLDDVLRRLQPRAAMPAGEIRFEQLEDFHPDRLYARLDLFKALRQARANPPTANADLGRLLGRPAEPVTVSPATAAGGIDALIRDIVAPHIVKDTSGQTAPYVAAVDAAIAEQMRAVLHHPAFQSLEAAWRGVRWLISSVELDENLQLHLLDVTREELLGDVVASEGRIAQTGLYRTVVDRSRNPLGAEGWSALVGLFQFGPSVADIGLLAALGLIASHAGGPLLAGADQTLAGDDAGALAGWHALRRSEAARWIGLALPRVLLRLPYGKVSDPIEAFAFEECVGPPAQDELLWGHASLATALLIGRGFTARGWDMEPGDEREIGDLPAYTFVRDGEPQMQACAEQLLTNREIDTLLRAGLTPIASHRDRNVVVAVRMQSVSDPPAPLAW